MEILKNGAADCRSCRLNLILTTFAIAFLFVGPAAASGWQTTDDFPYTLRVSTELAIIPSGAAVLTLGLIARETMALPSAQDIRKLNKGNLPAFDRSATYNYSETADKVSDLGLIAAQSLPLLLAASQLTDVRARWRNIVTLLVMLAESSMWTMGVTSLAKVLAGRPRPFAYNNAVSMELKMKKSFTSFFSGHTSDAFCNAVFFATVFSEMHPTSPWRFVVWGGALAVASTTGALRYVAGKHFPSDVLVGAAVGSLFGYMIPFLHRKKNWNPNRPIAVLPSVSSRQVGLNVVWEL